MLQWTLHQRIPRDPVENLKFRQFVLYKAAADPELQQAILIWCRHDIIAFINLFIVQFNPKKTGAFRVAPLITWKCQDDALLARPETHDGRRGILWCYENNKTAVVEKSREMGVSWLFLIFQAWLCICFEYTQALNISRSAEAVDDKSYNSLFWKIRHLNKFLPDWLKGPVVEQKMYIEYKRTSSIITGEASTGRAGVGGRAALIFVDEFQLIGDDREVRERTAGTADVRFFNGTHAGMEKEFYNLCQSPEIVKIQLHWSQHPEKIKGAYRWNEHEHKVEILDKSYRFDDYAFVREPKPLGGPFPGLRSPWYDWKCKDIGNDRGVAMELDIDPKGAVEQVFNALRIRELQAQFCRPPLWVGDILFDRDLATFKGLVPRTGGSLKLWLNPRPNGTIPPGEYKIGGDISSGSGATPSCLSILNASTGEKVGCYVDANVLPYDLASLAVALCHLFAGEEGYGAQLGWEIPGPGQTFGKRVVQPFSEGGLGYTRVLYRDNDALVYRDPSEIPGWVNNPQSKRVLIHEYQAALDQRHFINRDEEALEECLYFRYDASGNIEHSYERSTKDHSGARVNHGDRTIADAIAWRMAKGKHRVVKREAEQVKTVLSIAGRFKMWEDSHKQEAY